MESLDKIALLDFTKRWLSQFDYAPQNETLHGLPSPCILKTEKLTVFWRPVPMLSIKNLANVEQVMAIRLHASAHVFYGTQYAADMQATFKDVSLSLIQIWNDDDFMRLEKNLIAHLSMQKKLRRHPTIFIASTNDDSEIISLNNVTGEIVKENLITGTVVMLSKQLSDFLNELAVLCDE